jgi:membrane associated rhomboid family serine protease
MYRQPDPFSSMRGSLIRAGIPCTITLIATCAIVFLIDFFSRGMLGLLFWCSLDHGAIMPIWSPLTYALDTPGFINVVFGCLWLYWMGGSLERSWGTQRLAFFALGVTLLTALCVWLGTLVLRTSFPLQGMWIPLSALTVAWATLNPRQSILLYFVLPVPAWALALFEVGVVYFVYFQGNPALGLFGLLPSAAAYFYIAGGMSVGRGFTTRGPDLRIVKPRSTTLDGSSVGGGPLGWYRDWQERRRLRKLWRDSGFSDRDR